MVGHKDDYIDLWGPMGFVLGASIVGACFMYVGTLPATEWIYRYQTLIGAVIAVLTASWAVVATVKASNRQIEAVIQTTNEHIRSIQKLEDTRRADKLRARRAVLPFALTEIIEYCEQASSDLVSLQDQSRRDLLQGSLSILVTGNFKAPAVPLEALARITSVVEYASEEVSGELGALLVAMQICDARLRTLEDRIPHPESAVTRRSLKRHIVDVCALHARASRCFSYGRFENETIVHRSLDESEIFQSLYLLCFDSLDEEINELLHKEYSSLDRVTRCG